LRNASECTPRSRATADTGRPDSKTSRTPRSNSSGGYLRPLGIDGASPLHRTEPVLEDSAKQAWLSGQRRRAQRGEERDHANRPSTLGQRDSEAGGDNAKSNPIGAQARRPWAAPLPRSGGSDKLPCLKRWSTRLRNRCCGASARRRSPHARHRRGQPTW
jgi:hypothetical protein